MTTTTNINNAQVGDIFCCSWGYEQTNCDFYQVIEKPSPKTVIIKEITSEIVKVRSSASAEVVPVKDSFHRCATPIKKRVSSDNTIRFPYGNAYKVDLNKNGTFYSSWYA
jgi:hypothetical protein